MPIVLDIFCGNGGWSKAAHRNGWDTIGIDIDGRHYPGALIKTRCPVHDEVIRSIAPDAIVASPPCEEYARRHLPWLAKDRPAQLATAIELLNWAISLVGKFNCPTIIECSRFAARHVPGARFTGSYALWGDIPALLPQTPRRKQATSGLRPLRRAEIEPTLADWIFQTMPTHRTAT